ncbi:hypothetical protein EYF80_053872 [Liparis tanakae]|uniref:Uncharacterized protein n=1 Tax=Liparis tanakae TaxID=230148 RepID=A0A4Z2F492_9TELE|nr:hypothetical protein EYF80_053872 [Liparis tanakae]
MPLRGFLQCVGETWPPWMNPSQLQPDFSSSSSSNEVSLTADLKGSLTSREDDVGCGNVDAESYVELGALAICQRGSLVSCNMLHTYDVLSPPKLEVGRGQASLRSSQGRCKDPKKGGSKPQGDD